MEILGSAELKAKVFGPLADEVVRGRNQVVGGRQRGDSAIPIDKRPVLQVVVAIGDEHGERQPPGEFKQRLFVATAVDQVRDGLEVPCHICVPGIRS